MPVQETKSPEITRAAQRYLEQYGDPLVMNTYLKLTILVLGVICVMLGALTFKSQKALAGMKPLVIRINDVGHADAIDYRNYEYKPQEAENKYYLSRWAALYFQRNRYTCLLYTSFIGGCIFGHWVTNSDPAFLKILGRSEKFKLRYDAAKQRVPNLSLIHISRERHLL